MTEDVVKRQGYVKPIPPDPEMEKMDKKSMGYRYKLKRLQCITCFNTATQMLVYELEGCTKVERYCDGCVSKQENNQALSIQACKNTYENAFAASK